MSTAARAKPQENDSESELRARILDAAFATFMKSGYAASSTLEIATRARVSKRDLYSLVGNKQEMLVACISRRAKRFQVPADLPIPTSRQALAQLLSSFGAQLMREITDPTVIAVFRLAIAEAVNAPEVAQTLDSIGREANRTALRQIMDRAVASNLLTGGPTELAEQFSGLLWGILMIDLLLGVADRPSPRECAARSLAVAAAFLDLHPAPSSHRRPSAQ